MCTVILRVPDDAADPIRLLAVRDEDPTRAWDPLGAWWPDALPGVVGVRDARAGGAWLAADAQTRRLAVILNRAEVAGATGSRGAVVLGAVAGIGIAEPPDTNGFNLVEVTDGEARVTSWDGVSLRTRSLGPGVHMIAHDDVDDAGTARIARWLPEFAAAADRDGPLSEADGWMRLLERTASVPPEDDRAIVRDNRPHGYPTLSLLVCEATVGPDGLEVVYGELDEPGRWNRPRLSPPIPSRGEAPSS